MYVKDPSDQFVYRSNYWSHFPACLLQTKEILSTKRPPPLVLHCTVFRRTYPSDVLAPGHVPDEPGESCRGQRGVGGPGRPGGSSAHGDLAGVHDRGEALVGRVAQDVAEERVKPRGVRERWQPHQAPRRMVPRQVVSLWLPQKSLANDL